MRSVTALCLLQMALLVVTGYPAFGQEPDLVTQIRRCTAERDQLKRLDCMDAIAAAVKTETDANLSADLPDVPASVWRRSITKSPVDDSTEVMLALEASEPFRDRFGRPKEAVLVLRCFENRTAIYVKMDAFLSDHQEYGNVTLRVDNRPSFTKRMQESTSRNALGLWSGATSIPLIKELFGHKKLLVRLTPFSESAVTMDFPIAGVEEEIRSLRKACNW